jgi:hypothetical protein
VSKSRKVKVTQLIYCFQLFQLFSETTQRISTNYTFSDSVPLGLTICFYNLLSISQCKDLSIQVNFFNFSQFSNF